MPERDTDSFDGYGNGDLSAQSGGKWTDDTTLTAHIKAQANSVRGQSAGADHAAVITSWSGATGDQYGQLTIANSADGGGVLVRHDGDGTAYLGYTTGGGACYIYRINGGSFSQLDSAADTFSGGDVMYFEVQGYTLLMKRNSTTVNMTISGTSGYDDTTSASKIATGKPGLYVYDAGTAFLDDWSAGDFVAGGGGVVNPPSMTTMGVQ